jgi:hypothetical protein
MSALESKRMTGHELSTVARNAIARSTPAAVAMAARKLRNTVDIDTQRSLYTILNRELLSAATPESPDRLVEPSGKAASWELFAIVPDERLTDDQRAVAEALWGGEGDESLH